MTRKTGGLIFGAVIVIIIAFGLLFNLLTYSSLHRHSAYVPGIIIKVWNDQDGWYSKFEYEVKGIKYLRTSPTRHTLNDTVLVIYDLIKPEYAMIAAYPKKLIIDSNFTIKSLDTSLINYSWSNYLPMD